LILSGERPTMPTRRRPTFLPVGAATPNVPRSSRGGSQDTGRRLPGERPSGERAVSLRLAIGREGIGIELARPAHMGCLTVTELTVNLPGERFPVDVSGGVAKFRHRRGALSSLQIEVGATALERWAAPRLRGIVGMRAPDVWIGVRAAGATLCVAAVDDVESAAGPNDPPVVAFDIDLVVERDDLVFVLHGARGSSLPGPATAVAAACAEAILGGFTTRAGVLFAARHAARSIARALLPDAGARVPSTEKVGWTNVIAHERVWLLHAAHAAVAVAATEHATRAREAAGALREGDDALWAGDAVRARALYLEALERAPRHREIVRRIVEIDSRSAGLAEAALATLAEAGAERDDEMLANGAVSSAVVAARETDVGPHFGTTPGELLAEVGDVDAAVASFERAGQTEPGPALAARAFEKAARLTRDAEEASRLLDRALARAPRSASARWLRVTRRLELGRLEDALADVEHLEALARGARAKHLVWLRAGRVWRAAGAGARAGPIFERALRFVPDEPEALAGLGAALVDEGRKARGVAMLARAVDLAGARGEPTSSLILALSRALAEHLDDLPSAIARVAAIPPDALEGPVARGLEGRWRARLGDLAGAALSFARLRELAASFSPGRAGEAGDRRVTAVVDLLKEAAELQRTRLNDPRGAQRHIGAALRIRPHDGALRLSFREAGAVIAGIVSSEAAGVGEAASGAERRADGDGTPGRSFSFDLAPEEPDGDDDARAAAAARVEDLARRFQSNPRDDATGDELGSLLESLGRGHELLALLTARIEDATPEGRASLVPRARAALAHLAAKADEAGRADEANMYRDAMTNWLGP
jgi:cellulose synthase operon protein C